MGARKTAAHATRKKKAKITGRVKPETRAKKTGVKLSRDVETFLRVFKAEAKKDSRATVAQKKKALRVRSKKKTAPKAPDVLTNTRVGKHYGPAPRKRDPRGGAIRSAGLGMRAEEVEKEFEEEERAEKAQDQKKKARNAVDALEVDRSLQSLSRTEVEQVRDEALSVSASSSLGAFGWYVYGWRPADHHKEWIEVLEDTSVRRILIVCPPGHAKTNWVSIAYPSWRLGQDHNLRIGFISSTARQAYRPSVTIREALRYSEKYRDVFPGVEPDTNRGWAQDEWYIKRSDASLKDASFFATGTLGPVIGARMDEVIIDDVCDQENMASKHMRGKVRDWVEQTVLSRVVPGGRIISVMTRWHEEDLMSLLEKLPSVVVIHMPALGYWEMKKGLLKRAALEQVSTDLVGQEPVVDIVPFDSTGNTAQDTEHTTHGTEHGTQETTTQNTGNSCNTAQVGYPLYNSTIQIRGTDKKAKNALITSLLSGSALWPSEWPKVPREDDDGLGGKIRKEGLLEIEARNPPVFTNMYQGFPSRPEGEIFRRDWWRFHEILKDLVIIIQSWDTAFKQATTADYSACVTFVVTETQIAVVDVMQERLEFPALLSVAEAKWRQYKPAYVLIEDSASGQSLFQALQKSTPFMPVFPVKVGVDKVSRAHSTTGLIQSGRVTLPVNAPWVVDFVDQLADFPKGAYDDKADAFIQGVNFIIAQEVARFEERLTEDRAVSYGGQGTGLVSLDPGVIYEEDSVSDFGFIDVDYNVLQDL